MSLNYKEINRILEELDLPGAKIQKIFQPSYDTIILELYRRGERLYFLASVAAGACRIHSIPSLSIKNERPLRFMECLRSRIRNGSITEAIQIENDRIIQISIQVHSEAGEETLVLFLKLWSGAGNILLVDEKNTIIDALYRRPKKGESSGEPFSLEKFAPLRPHHAAGADSIEAKDFAIRDLLGDGSFNEKVHRFYSEQAGQLSRDALLEEARIRYEKRKRFFEQKLAELEKRKIDYENAERYRQIGDILMAESAAQASITVDTKHLKSPRGTSTFLHTTDFYTNSPISIQLDSSLSLLQNAQAYYERSRKAKTGRSAVEEELVKLREAMASLETWKETIIKTLDPFLLAKMLAKGGTVREKPKNRYPCIAIDTDGWTFLIGRSAKENDEILRRHVRGSDMWLHARDYAGSYVFIKVPRGKTVPLTVLLDAGMLALYYSKGRKNIDGDIYYTPVKQVRRAKDGPKGLVIPMLEKNLHVRIDPERLKALLSHTNEQQSGEFS